MTTMIALILLACGSAPGPGRFQEAPPGQQAERPEGFVFVKSVVHNGAADWTDTGIDVKRGEEFYFEAEGSVSLQKDNPVAVCGPEGLALRTLQQPLADQNLGCLLGRIVVKTEVTEDKQTGEKTIRRFGEIFFIGRKNQVPIPTAGRLFLGVNENVTGDNDGQFSVGIYRKKLG